MKIKSKFKVILFIIPCILFITACHKENDNIYSINDKEKFEKNTNEIISIIKKDDSNNNISDWNSYYINENYITYNDKYIYDIKKYNMDDGIITIKENNQMYVSLLSGKFCAIKDFEDEKISIYNNGDERCHKLHILSENLFMMIYAYDLVGEKEYKPGTIINNYISLTAVTNILDSKSVKYQWYRNDEKIENANVQNYTVAKDYEDANYYVEITTNTGEVYKSESVNVKIDKES